MFQLSSQIRRILCSQFGSNRLEEIEIQEVISGMASVMFYELSLINYFSSNFGSYRKCLKSRSRELHNFGDIDKRVKEETLTKH